MQNQGTCTLLVFPFLILYTVLLLHLIFFREFWLLVTLHFSLNYPTVIPAHIETSTIQGQSRYPEDFPLCHCPVVRLSAGSKEVRPRWLTEKNRPGKFYISFPLKKLYIRNGNSSLQSVWNVPQYSISSSFFSACLSLLEDDEAQQHERTTCW